MPTSPDSCISTVFDRKIVVEKINQREKTAAMVAGQSRLGSDSPGEGLAIIVFITANSIASKVVNTALYLAR